MKINRIMWTAVFVFIGLALVWHCWQSVYDHDEIEHLHAAWMISQGLLPFADFVEQHHPTLWYLLAPLAGLFRSPHNFVFVVRLFDLAGFAALLFVLSKIIRKLYPEVDSRWPVLLLLASFLFVRKEIEIRPDPWMNLFCFAGLFYWISYFQSEKKRAAFFSGCFFGFSIVMLQKAIPWILPVILSSALLCVLHFADKKRVMSIVTGTCLLLMGLLIPILFFLSFINSLGIWNDFVFWNYTFNKFFYLSAEVPTYFSSFSIFYSAFMDNPLLCFVGALGIVIIIWECLINRKSLGAKADGCLVIAFVALGLLPLLLKNKFPFFQYMIPWLPLIAIASSGVFLLVRKTSVELVLKSATALTAVYMVFLLFTTPSNASQNQMQKFFLDHTNENAAVFVPPPGNPIFRRDGAYFWFNASLVGKAYARYCVINGCDKNFLDLEREEWIQNKPRYVYIQPNISEFHPLNWQTYMTDYVPTKILGLFVLKTAK